jgi:polar amino acid transport system permease protein
VGDDDRGVLARRGIEREVGVEFSALGPLMGGLALVLLRRIHPWVDRGVSWFVDFIRNTPLLVQILFLYLVLPEYGIVLTFFQTAVLAMSIHYSSFLSEVFRAGIDAVPRGQWEAARALNFTATNIYARIVIPQMIPSIVPSAGNILVYMFKDSPLLAAISLVELVFTAQSITAETFNYLEPMTEVGIIFLVMGRVSAQFVRIVERNLGSRWLRTRNWQ